MAVPYDPNFTIALGGPEIEIEDDKEHDISASAAIVAVNLISATRLALELDSEHTEYSAQYLVDNVCSYGEGGVEYEITLSDCLKFALSKGVPKAENWTHFGCVIKPPSSFEPDLISMKGDVIETNDINEARELLKYQPVGAKLHVFSPQIDLVGDGIYCGSSGEPTGYVGLRDVIMVGVQKIQGKAIATVKMWYKKKFVYVKVALSRMFLHSTENEDGSCTSEATILLVDFVVPRLSTN